MPIINPPVVIPAAIPPFALPDVSAQVSLASGTAPGSFANSARYSLPVNTLARNAIGATLASPRVTLPAGSYRFRCSRSIYGNATAGQRCQERLRDNTNGVNLFELQFDLNGTASTGGGGLPFQTEGLFAIAGACALSWDMFSNNIGYYGTDVAVGSGDPEIPFQLDFFKFA